VLPVHVVSTVQTLLEVRVEALASYCAAALHVASEEHCRSLADVGAAL
jgi:hypothetical protein